MKFTKVMTLIFTITLSVSLAACGSNNSSKGESESSPQGGSPQAKDNGKAVKIVYWYVDDKQKDALEEITNLFNTAHPKIQVTAQQVANKEYYTKLQTTLVTNTGPDIMWMDGPDFPTFQTKGFLLPLNEYIKRDSFDMNNYPKSLVDLYSLAGNIYGMPKDFDTIGLYYNKKLFDAKKVTYPNENWTWDDLKKAAKELTVVQDGKAVQWGFAASSGTQESIYPFMIQGGAKLINDDKKSSDVGSVEAISGVQFLYDMMYTDKTSPDGKYMIDNNPGSLFTSGKVAMMMGGDWNTNKYYNALKGDLEVAKLPKGKQAGNIIHGIGWIINAKTKYPEQSWEFLKWLGSKEAALIQANTGTVIPAFKGTQDYWVKSFPIATQVFIDMAADASPYPVTAYPVWESSVETHIANIWLDAEKPEAGMKAAQTEIDKVLAGGK